MGAASRGRTDPPAFWEGLKLGQLRGGWLPEGWRRGRQSAEESWGPRGRTLKQARRVPEERRQGLGRGAGGPGGSLGVTPERGPCKGVKHRSAGSDLHFCKAQSGSHGVPAWRMPLGWRRLDQALVGVPGKKGNIPEKTGGGRGEWRGLGSAARAACEVPPGRNGHQTVTREGVQGRGWAWCEPPPGALGPQPW